MAVRTLTELFFVASGYDKPDCLLHKVGGEYKPISTRELVDRVQRLAKALREIGVVRGDRVALMAENGPHWPTIDFAALCSRWQAVNHRLSQSTGRLALKRKNVAH